MSLKFKATNDANAVASPSIQDRKPPLITHSVFDELSDSAFIRESQLVPSPKRPCQTYLLPFSAPTLWRKVKAGTFPRPIKLSNRITCWKVGEVRAWIDSQADKSR
jgi:prophage regulatory protein